MALFDSARFEADPQLGTLIVAAEAQDGISFGHSARVQALSRLIGRELGIDSAELRELEFGAFLHDIGKLGVPRSILSSPLKLTETQMVWVRTHPEVGCRILAHRAVWDRCLGTVMCHHERLDGSGYPNALRGAQIPLHARIVAVADVFDAMSSPRPYREALPRPEVVVRMLREAELGRLDEKIVRVLADSMEEASLPDGVPVCAA